MLGAPYLEKLRQEGFQLIGEFAYRIRLSVWWNPDQDKLLQVIVLSLGQTVLLKGDKTYYMKSVSAEGETWARDIGLLHDYLEGHFPELRISFSHFREVPAGLAEVEARRRLAIEAPTEPPPTLEQLARLQDQVQAMQRDVQSTDSLVSLMGNRSDLLNSYLRGQTRTGREQIKRLQAEIDGKRQRLGLLEHLQREYRQKGSAAVYSFGISSDLQLAANAGEFSDGLRAVVKELTDVHRYQVAQKLGGRLNIRVAEATEPALAWIEQWFGGAFIQICLPVRRSKQYRFRFLPESSAQVTKTRPCETIGLLLPGPGSVAFHRTLFVGPQWSGALSSSATPFP